MERGNARIRWADNFPFNVYTDHVKNLIFCVKGENLGYAVSKRFSFLIFFKCLHACFENFVGCALSVLVCPAVVFLSFKMTVHTRNSFLFETF